MTAHSHALSGPIGQPAPRAAGGAVPASVRAARLDDIPAILTLHQEAFADKYGGAFGRRHTDRGARALAAAWRKQGNGALRGMLVAEHEGQVIGTTSVRTWEMGGDDGAAAELAFQEELGFWGATRSIYVLSLLDHRIERGEAFITDVAVLAPMRRGGVARAMLVRAEQEARLRAKRYLGLYVSARNQGARQLYLSLGFYEVRVRRSLMARLLFGQGSWIYMRKDLL